MSHRRRPGFAAVALDNHPQRRDAAPVTCARDGGEHLVSEHTMTTVNAGRYVAWCGRQILAAALVCPPGRPCPDCLAIGRVAACARRTDRVGVWVQQAARLRGQR